MKALVKDSRTPVLRDIPIPQLNEAYGVLIRVKLAGICRTDINVCKGLFESPDGIVLGHEFCGVIELLHVENHDGAERPLLGANGLPLSVGQWVTVDPTRFGPEEKWMCGVEVDGAFAEFIRVPAHAVFPLPESITPECAALVEPIAASLAVLNAGLDPASQGAIWGDNRIAQLTQRILAIHGFSHVSMISDQTLPVRDNQFDFLIETQIDSARLQAMVRLLKLKGTLVLKSRQREPVSLMVHELVKKDLTLKAVHYGSFETAIELLASGRLDVSDLIGKTYPLSAFEEAFQASQGQEAQKCFLQV
jgi:threonine dehydrogenase-like Zn-dependent dehydrogenase